MPLRHCRGKFLFESCFKCGDLRFDRFNRLELEGFCGFESVAGDCNHKAIGRLDPPLGNQFSRHSQCGASGSFSEDAFGFRQQLDRIDNFTVARILAPSAAISDYSRSEVPISGISDRKRLGNRVRFDRSNVTRSGFNSRRNRIAAGCLSSLKAGSG
jgi:hypothetical protein